MKIAFVVHDFLQGTGHGRYCIELAKRFAEKHEVHILANTFEPNLDFPFHKHFAPAWRSVALTSVLTFPKAAEKLLTRESFNIIHAQGYACHRANVITAHICNAARYARTPAKGLIKKLFPMFVIPRERAFYQHSGALEVIAISKVIQRELSKEYQVGSSVVYHGVDTAQFNSIARSPTNTWLFVGEAVKGLAQAILALTHFPMAQLVVVSKSDCGKFKALARELTVADRISFRGATPDMPRIYQEADLFIYPSEYDAFGMVVAEAMASGLPVIIGKNIGAAEWIRDGENGFLCDPNDLNSIVSQIRRAEKCPVVREQARATALAHTWDACAEQTLKIYERAISSKRTSK
jgi:UDP-glucose:(heptosyl)LPS alpha-1,3-glucosyltransferase